MHSVCVDNSAQRRSEEVNSDNSEKQEPLLKKKKKKKKELGALHRTNINKVSKIRSNLNSITQQQ